MHYTVHNGVRIPLNHSMVKPYEMSVCAAMGRMLQHPPAGPPGYLSGMIYKWSGFIIYSDRVECQ